MGLQDSIKTRPSNRFSELWEKKIKKRKSKKSVHRRVWERFRGQAQKGRVGPEIKDKEGKVFWGNGNRRGGSGS